MFFCPTKSFEKKTVNVRNTLIKYDSYLIVLVIFLQFILIGKISITFNMS